MPKHIKHLWMPSVGQTGPDQSEIVWAKFSSIADEWTGRSNVIINKNLWEVERCRGPRLNSKIYMKHDDFWNYTQSLSCAWNSHCVVSTLRLSVHVGGNWVRSVRCSQRTMGSWSQVTWTLSVTPCCVYLGKSIACPRSEFYQLSKSGFVSESS